ncbi:synaptic vesicle glycoprotein 2B-like [Aedes albopictus]|uniref:Major facilitator superfamily (MFS) profile domain-containing protein n=1 Tax=Aedes albopictus TaxID=7160 RepID=A0ABM1YLU0_AEDAL
MAPPCSVSMVFSVEPIKAPQWQKRSHSYEEALELVGYGRAQILLVMLSGFAIMASINEAMGLSIILPASQCDLGLDPGEKGMIGGAIFLGIMASSYFWGYQADTRGRQIVMKYSLIVTSICSVASSFASGFVSLMVLRFITGVCVAAPSATVYAYLGEFCTPSRRVQLISYASVMPSVGIIFVALVGWLTLSFEWSFPITDTITYKPWRLLFILYTIPGLVAGVVFFFFPETPKFLLSQGREDEALAVLKWMYRINHGAGSECNYKVEALRTEAGEVKVETQSGLLGVLKSMKDQTLPLLKFPHLKYFLVSCVHSASAFTIYGGLGLWFPQIMNQISSDPSDGTEICSVLQQQPAPTNSSILAICESSVEQDTFIYTAMLGVFGATYCITLSFILRKFKGSTMMVLNMTTAGVAGILLQFFTNSYLVAVLFCVEIMFAGICVMLVNARAVSLFPTHVRGMAVSLVNMIGRLSCFTASAVIGLLMSQNCPLTFYFLSGMLFVSAAVTFLLPPEE